MKNISLTTKQNILFTWAFQRALRSWMGIYTLMMIFFWMASLPFIIMLHVPRICSSCSLSTLHEIFGEYLENKLLFEKSYFSFNFGFVTVAIQLIVSSVGDKAINVMLFSFKLKSIQRTELCTKCLMRYHEL